ncbi:MAG TPA: hypothetical protein VMD49_10075 [Steroidobacteraceae bacterium]|nr:hypothetical protein [Steroidobacteraceae bacterium]
MRILGKVLVGLGTVFAIIIAFFVWLGIAGQRFKTAEIPFVTQFVTDLSRHWDVADVYDRSTPTLIEQASSAQGRQALETFKQLGALRSVHDFALRNYYRGTGGATAVLSMQASFEYGDAVVEVTLQRRAGAVRVNGFFIRELKMRAHAGAREIAAPRQPVRILPLGALRT